MCIKVSPLKIFRIYNLLVCPKSEPLIEFFSELGEVVTLMSRSIVWYRKTAKVDNVILIGRSDIPTYRDEYKQMHEDLDSRFNASPLSVSLVLSNLSLEDSGEY